MTSRRQEPIAIVGLGGLFPGSLDVAQLWNHVLQKSDLVTEIPETHWRPADYFDADPKAPDKTYARRGAFLPKIPFDPLKEGIPPSLLPSTDTSQLLALLVARTTLEEAVGPLERADKTRISCLLGVTSGQELFGQMASRLRQPEWRAGMRAAGIDEASVERAVKLIGDAMVPWNEATFPGLLGNVVAGRIANRLDLGGTNAVTDAACASSFAAISMAVDELVLRRADVVLTGGVDTLNDIFMHMCFSKTPALSASGDCRPFDANADGTLLGEGLGMVALKRLADAERDDDAIYAVLRGVGTSSDGKSKSVYAPVPEGQAKALRRAYAAAGYTPDTVELVEGHGTGTRAGDVAEIEGLKIAFEESGRKDRQWCAVGSIKSQIGHTKSAAGAAGLLKAALALHEKILPPTCKVSTPNPGARFSESPFYVGSEARPWVRAGDHPRRASVSSFGFGGSNFHLALEEYTGDNRRPARLSRRGVELWALSADSDEALRARARALLEGLEAASQEAGKPALDLARWSREVLASFEAKAPHRASFVAANLEEARTRLLDVAQGKASPQLFTGKGAPGKVAILFPGQGSQQPGMGAALAMHFDAARAVLDRAEDVLPLSRLVFPIPAFSDDDRSAQRAALTRTENAQPALGAVSMAFLRVLEELGLSCDMAAGHSFGELSALCAAGSMDEATLVRLARRRGELMGSASSEAGAMAAVLGDARLVPEQLAGLRVVVANHNAPDQCVISGEVCDVDEAMKRLAAAGFTVKKLLVSTAFHSPLVEGAVAPFGAALAAAGLRPTRFPVYANTTAKPHGEPSAMRAELARQIGAPVRFVDEVRAMREAGATVFLEVGPGNVLTGLVSRIAPDAMAIATDGKGEGLKPFWVALARLCAAGVSLKLDRIPLPAASRAPVASKSSVWINGANLGKPALPKPAPAPHPVVKPTPPPPMPAPRAAAPLPPQALAPSAPSSRTAPMTQKPAAPLSASFLDVFREGQRQSAEAHLALQRALLESHQAYMAAFEATQSALLAAASGAPIVMGETTTRPAALPAMSAPVMAAPVMSAPLMAAPATLAAPAPMAVAKTNGHGNGHSHGHGNGHGNGNGNGNGSGRAPVLPAPSVVAPPLAKENGAADARSLLLDVVADKTGYPKDSLDDGMNLEADLGIDSIKRVEILGALKDKLPAAGQLDALKLAQLKTLGEIALALAGAK
ncbi:MAG: acyltransferase domain-containing protein, partial [Deltaproteobacteria bacterium]|nr:acyltransferase domain-containing protein [Deltaproteobacteria bacterium]